MATMKTETKHRIDREDALAAADIARTAATTVVSVLPEAMLIGWTYKKLREPIRVQHNASLVLSTRMMMAVAPFAAILGLMYQGWTGSIAGTITTAVEGLIGGMSVKPVKKDDPNADPFPGDIAYLQLDFFDALFLATWFPLVLRTLRSEGKETASVTGI